MIINKNIQTENRNKKEDQRLYLQDRYLFGEKKLRCWSLDVCDIIFQ